LAPRGIAMLVLAAGIAAALPSSQTHAQEVFVTQSITSGGGGSGMVKNRSIEKYAELLGLTPDQKEAAAMIQSGYAAAYDAKQKARREQGDEVRRLAEDSGEQNLFMEKMPKIEKEYREATDKLEKDLFNDLKALLNGPKQEEAWGRVERMRRREVALKQGTLSGEAVDLIDVVDGLKLDGESAKAAGQTLETYEMDLDRLLQARLAKKDDAPGWEPGKPIDIDKMEAAMKESREEGAKVRDLNRESARKIESLLPDDKKPAFADAFKRGCFPRVYRTPRVAKEIDAAMKLGDIESSQKEQITELKAAYDKEAQGVNEKLAKAIEENESSGKSGGSLAGGGGRMTMMFGDEPQPLQDARKARRELDEKSSAKLRSILTAAQKEKLPKTFPGDEEGQGGFGGKMIMRRSE